ncbi:MAG: transglutaminase domain-containing protein [Phycisphaerae bacterium]|nr:transglutaminase domain-containing protein [Phycisphaerae bacterium]
MKHQTNIAVIMLISSSVFCALVLKDAAYPAILCVLGLLGLRRKIILAIQPERRVFSLLILLFLLALFGIHYWFFVWPSHGRFGPEANIAWHTVTRYFLASMVLMLFLGLPDELPLSFGFFYVATIVSAGQVFLMDDKIGLFRSLEMGSVMLLLLYSSMALGSPLRHLLDKKGFPSRTPLFLVLAAFLITLNVGWMLGSVLYDHQNAIMFLSNLWKNQATLLAEREVESQIGFSRSGILSTLQNRIQSEDQEAVLRVTSDHTPGYLRAQTFPTYRRGQWSSQSGRWAITTDQTRWDISLGNRVRVYNLRRPSQTLTASMVIKHVADLEDTTFLPANVFELAISDSYLVRDADFIVFRSLISAQTLYSVKYSQTLAGEVPTPAQRNILTGLRGTLRDQLETLSDSLYRDCVTTQDKINATLRYFNENYTYSLAMPLAQDGDPLIQFLLQGNTGYCEYFASGAALLLRCANVPTRYVTGFYVTEKEGHTANTFVARNKDAHAWVEAWDDEQQCWRIVEATVQDALDDTLANGSGTLSGLQRFAFVQQITQALYQYGVLGILVWIYSDAGFILQFFVSLAIALGLVLVFRKLSRQKRRAGSMRHSHRSAQWHKLHTLRMRLDRGLQRKGLQRQPHETLLAFARNLTAPDLGPGTVAAIQTWCTQYNQLRYSREIPSLQLEQLTHSLRELLRDLSRRRRQEEKRVRR